MTRSVVYLVNTMSQPQNEANGNANIGWDPHELVTLEDLPRVNAIVNISRFGNVPEGLMEEKTAERCVMCGRGSTSDSSHFDLGVRHALERLGVLLVHRAGTSQEEADAILAKLRSSDVELP